MGGARACVGNVIIGESSDKVTAMGDKGINIREEVESTQQQQHTALDAVW